MLYTSFLFKIALHNKVQLVILPDSIIAPDNLTRATQIGSLYRIKFITVINNNLQNILPTLSVLHNIFIYIVTHVPCTYRLQALLKV